MSLDRFETLAEAYGGDVARWPDAEREAAAALMTERPDWAQGVLARAGELDAQLAAYAPRRAAAGLMDAIIASAPQARRGRRWRAWLVPAGMGAGLAAACAAGVVLGGRLAAPPAASDADAVVAAVSDFDAGLTFDEGA
jgi:hypothetical protein